MKLKRNPASALARSAGLITMRFNYTMNITQPVPEKQPTSGQNLTIALDSLRFDAVVEFADLAASYWRSAAEAALRGDRTTLEVHCRQLAAVTREAFQTVKELGSDARRAT